VTPDQIRNAVATAMLKQQAPQYGFGPYAKAMQGLGEGMAQRFAPPQQPGAPLSLAPPPQQPVQQAQPAEPWMPPASWEN
jgi:hypothetical protein